MGTTKKRDSICAFRLHAGKGIGSAEWGDSGDEQTLGAGDAFAYETIAPKGNSETVPDNTVDGLAHPDLPNQVKKYASVDGWGGTCRYSGMDKLLYWSFGYENPRTIAGAGGSPSHLYEFTVSGVTVTPTNGATYTNNGDTFTVLTTSISGGSGTIRTERTDGSSGPQASGTLTKTGGTGDASITYSAVDSDYYAHFFELDKNERGITDYRSTEVDTSTPDPADYDSTDKKNRCITLGIKRGPQDARYTFLMCTGFSFQSDAGQPCKWSANGIGYKEERGDYSSGTWTFGSDAAGSSLNIMHHHFTVSVAPSGGAFVDLAVKSFSIQCDIPLINDQSTESGLYLESPEMNGRYNVKMSLTLARHSVDTYLQYRDDFQNCFAKFVASSGNYQFGLYLPDMIIDDTYVDESEVANLPISWTCAKEPSGGNPFDAGDIGDFANHIIQSGPLFCYLINKNSNNEMWRE